MANGTSAAGRTGLGRGSSSEITGRSDDRWATAGLLTTPRSIATTTDRSSRRMETPSGNRQWWVRTGLRQEAAAGQRRGAVQDGQVGTWGQEGDQGGPGLRGKQGGHRPSRPAGAEAAAGGKGEGDLAWGESAAVPRTTHQARAESQVTDQ